MEVYDVNKKEKIMSDGQFNINDQFFDNLQKIMELSHILRTTGRKLQDVGNDKLGNDIVEISEEIYNSSNECSQAFRRQISQECHRQNEHVGIIMKSLVEGLAK